MKGESYKFIRDKINKNWNIPKDFSGEYLIGGLDDRGNELYYFINFDSFEIVRCEIYNEKYRKKYADYLQSKMALQDLPYGLDNFDDLVLAFLQPHEALKLESGWIAVAMHNADYIRLIDFQNEEISNYPDCDEFMPVIFSATDSLSPTKEKLFFANWSLDERIKRYCGNNKFIQIHIKSINSNLDQESETDIGTIEGIEGLHEVKCSPDGKYVLLTEFCLQAIGKVPQIQLDNYTWKGYQEWNNYEKLGLKETKLSAISIDGENIDNIEPRGLVPGHVEFSNLNENKFYLSCHAMSKANGKVVLHEQGVLEEYIYEDGVIKSQRYFSAPDFIRLTSHKIFEYNGKSYIAITGYPNYLFLFEDDTFEVIKKIKLFDCYTIDISRMHVCTLDDRTPIWLDTSDNGKYIILISNKLIYIYNIETSEIVINEGYNWYNDFVGTAHVTNMNDFNK